MFRMQRKSKKEIVLELTSTFIEYIKRMQCQSPKEFSVSQGGPWAWNFLIPKSPVRITEVTGEVLGKHYPDCTDSNPEFAS